VEVLPKEFGEGADWAVVGDGRALAIAASVASGAPEFSRKTQRLRVSRERRVRKREAGREEEV
jgi:hypothetical protein